jgi:hypothetical protein
MRNATAVIGEQENPLTTRIESVPAIVVLSSSLLADRIFLHTGLLPSLRERSRVRLWATSAANTRYRDMWTAFHPQTEQFPAVLPFREFPYNYLRRLNEFAWDFRLSPPSRLSIYRHTRQDRMSPSIRALRIPARILSMLNSQGLLETGIEKLLYTYSRSPESRARFLADRPDVVFTTGPFQFEQPAVIAEACNLGIPVLALIPSWDNVSTKNRMVFNYDGYVVWSERTKEELHYFYPATRKVPVYVTGAPQFDVFFQEKFYLSREEFCANYGLRPDLPIIVYTIGSPNFIRGEHHGAVQLAERMAGGEIGDAQMIVRPHPIHDNGKMNSLFEKYYPRVIVQKTADAEALLTARSQDEDQIIDWVNTFRHADVVINLASTVTVDAAIFDRPVINLDFDPEPGQPHQQLIKEINHLWTHFKPVAESGGVWNVNDIDEMVSAIRAYLARPELHRQERRWLAEYVCQHLDGRCGERMAEALLDFSYKRMQEVKTR